VLLAVVPREHDVLGGDVPAVVPLQVVTQRDVDDVVFDDLVALGGPLVGLALVVELDEALVGHLVDHERLRSSD
jgi:hypothetical protein